jgi:ParB-like chromosome segregation protein Spo0J
MKITDIKIGDRARRDPGDIESLAKSIQQVGLLHPIVTTPNNELVSGYRRIEAYKQLGRDGIPHRVAENLDDARKLLQAERDENTERKELSPSEMVALAAKLEPIEHAEAEKRKKAASTTRKSKTSKHTQENPAGSCGGKLPPREKGKSRDKVAAAVGTSERTLKKAKEVVVAAHAEPEKYGALVEEMDATGKVDPAYRKLKKMKASDAGGEAEANGKLRHWIAGLSNIQRFIDQTEKDGSPACILDAMSGKERQDCVFDLQLMAYDFMSWSEILEGKKPDEMSFPPLDPATVEPGEGKTSPADELAAPVSQQAISEHIETVGHPVVVAQDGSDPEQPEWKRYASHCLQEIKRERDADTSEMGHGKSDGSN